jgi:Mrp family chromosome partitioning ATPase
MGTGPRPSSRPCCLHRDNVLVYGDFELEAGQQQESVGLCQEQRPEVGQALPGAAAGSRPPLRVGATFAPRRPGERARPLHPRGDPDLAGQKPSRRTESAASNCATSSLVPARHARPTVCRDRMGKVIVVTSGKGGVGKT